MSRFVPNASFQEELKLACIPHLVGAAHAIKSRAETEKHSIMPRKSSAPIVVESSGEELRVVNTDHGGHIDEWGSAKSPAYAPLRRAVRALGLRLNELGK